MAKYSNHKEVCTYLKLLGATEPVLFLLEEHVKNAEAEILGCSPTDPNMRDRLVKSQTIRQLFELLKRDLK